MGGACSGNRGKEDTYAPKLDSHAAKSSDATPKTGVRGVASMRGAPATAPGSQEDSTVVPHTVASSPTQGAMDGPAVEQMRVRGQRDAGGTHGGKQLDSPRHAHAPLTGHHSSAGERHDELHQPLRDNHHRHSNGLPALGNTPLHVHIAAAPHLPHGGAHGHGGEVTPNHGRITPDPGLLPFMRPPAATVPLGWAEPSPLDAEEEEELKQQTMQVSAEQTC